MDKIINYKPTTPGRRHASVLNSHELTKPRLKRLLVGKRGHAGRNNQGKITVRHQGSGVKQKLRLVDFKQDKWEVPGVVSAIEYDPGRTANLGLIKYADGDWRYVIVPEDVKVGQQIVTSQKKLIMEIGNRFPLWLIPAGTLVCNVELYPGSGGKLARSAGNALTLMLVEGDHAQVKMPSGEIRKISKNCLATIGQTSNQAWRTVRFGKAGRKIKMGIRPSVRGKVMNPVDHPHGGGEGKNPVGLKQPKNVYGKKALGVKTRSTKKLSDKLIVQRRKRKTA
ncbi:MAG: 50S ribosomal protein L2 [Candidatus Komeilibacteria bacterium]|nr:50S ribosomal protein L2 [Candidatus Komeilibacteria bacterium]